MNLSDIQNHISNSHEQFLIMLEDLDSERFEYSPNEVKWSGGQQLEHIYKSAAAIAKVLKMPNWFLRWKFGKANRPSRSYEELKSRYLEKLEKVKGVTAPGFEPTKVMLPNRAGLCAGTRVKVNSINSSLNKFSEKQLDTFILPHPLLGYITVREMGMFCAFHAEHHEKSVLLVLDHLNTRI